MYSCIQYSQFNSFCATAKYGDTDIDTKKTTNNLIEQLSTSPKLIDICMHSMYTHRLKRQQQTILPILFVKMSIRNRDRFYSSSAFNFMYYYIIIQSIFFTLFFLSFSQDLRELRCRRCSLKKIESSLFRNIRNLLELDVGANYVSELLSMDRVLFVLENDNLFGMI